MPQCETAKLRRSAGLEALARCVTETQASMVYRCLANYTGNTVLKSLLKRMSIDEVRHFRYFKNIHQHHENKEENRFIRKIYTIVARSELVRDEDIALAFFPLNTCWVELPPFRPWDYQQFLAYMAQVIKVYFPFDEAKRMLFHPLHAKKRLERLLIQITGKIITRQFMRYG